MLDDKGNSDVEAQEVPILAFGPSHEAKLRELLHKVCSLEVKLCSDATKEFVKLLRGETGGELLCLYVRNSSNFSELLEAWKLRQGKQGLSYIFSLIYAILSHPEGKGKLNDVSRAIDKFGRLVIEEKLDDIYKELNSKEGKRQNAALLLLTSIVRRGSSFAWDVAKKFDFKLQGFAKLAEYKSRGSDKIRKHSTRKAFVGFAVSFLEVGKPGLLRWVIQQKEMYSGVLQGLGKDDDETLVYVLSTLKDRVLVDESLIPPGLRSVLFGSFTLEQLVSISAREDGGAAIELAHNVLLKVCTDPCNGLMPDPKRHLRGNPKRLLMLMKRLRAAELGYHRDLLIAIVRGRPSLASAFLDEFPYNVEDYTSPTWFSSISLAANLVTSVAISCPFDFLYSQPCDTPLFGGLDIQSIMKCICPRAFSRSVINKGLLHSDFLVKHGTLRFLLETLKLLDSFVTALNRCSYSSIQMKQSWGSLEQEIQNEVRNFFPDPQVLLTLLSSLGGWSGTQKPCLKRKAKREDQLADRKNGLKKSKKNISEEDSDIIIGGISSGHDTFYPKDGDVVDPQIVNEVDAGKEFLATVSEIWSSDLCSKPVNSLEDAEIYFHTKLLNALSIYMHTVHNALEGSFDFFMNLLSNPSSLPADLQNALLSLLYEYISWTPKSPSGRVPIRTPPLMYKHLQVFINLLLLSPHNEVKDMAYDLALAAMSSTGAFDKNPNEIGVWFLFLPGYGKNKLPFEVQEAVHSLSSVVISFLCDAVSTVGNNLFKHWDIIRSKASHFRRFKGVPIEFSPLVICVLQKCLRLLNSESKTYSLSEKSTVSLYVCNSVKYLLQTQVDTGLLSSLIHSVLSEAVDDSKDSFCEWRPLRSLLLFSKTLLDKKPFYFCSGREKAQPAASSFADTLDQVKKLVKSVPQDEIAGIVKAFSSALLCTTPDVILESFVPVMTVSWALFGAPFSFVWSITFVEEDVLGSLFKRWPEMFVQGLETAVSVNLHKVTADEKSDTSDHSPITEEIIHKMNIDDNESSALSIFLNQAPFHILFPAIMSMGVSCLGESSKIAELLVGKISESKSDYIISYIQLILFWFGQIRSSYNVQRASVLCQLSEVCLILMKHLFFRISEGKLDSGPSSSNLVLASAKWKQEVALIVFSNPVVIAALESPLSSGVEFEAQNFEIYSTSFLTMCKRSISEIDHHILDLLALTCDQLFHNGHAPKVECGVNQSVLMAFKALIERLLLQLRVKFQLGVDTENFTPLYQTLYLVHVLLKFICPFKLLHLAHSTLNVADAEGLTIQDFSKILSVGFGIAGVAFEMLFLYLQQPAAKRHVYDFLWALKDNSYDSYLAEEIYGLACKFSTSLVLDSADICLLKAVTAIFKCKHNQNHDVHPLTLVLARIVVRTPKDLIFHCVNQANMARAKLLFYLVELSPLHLSVFGHLFLSKLDRGKGDAALTDDQFLMLLPAALSYLSSVLVKKKYYQSFVKITSVYSCILRNGFRQWESFVSGYMFEENYDDLLELTTEEPDNLFNASLLGKSIRMFQYHFALSGRSTKTDLFKVFSSIFPCTNDCNEMLDYELKELGFHSLDNILNVVIRVVAKVSLLRMWQFPDDSGLFHFKGEADNSVKESSLETGSSREDLSMWLMNILVNSWQCVVEKSTSLSAGSLKGKLDAKSDEYRSLYKSLEKFFLRVIVEFVEDMREELAQVESLPFLEKLMKLVLLYRFEDAMTLKRLRNIFTLLSRGKFSRAPYLQLLISHSHFMPTLSSLSRSSCSHTGELFRPVSSILKHLMFSHPNQDGVRESDLGGPEQYMQGLETVKILSVLLCKCGKDVDINLRELHFLLLSSYGASLSEIDLEIYKLMHKIELIDGSHTINVTETGYLWGKAAIKIRNEQALDQDVSDVVKADSVKEGRRIQFREHLCIDPKLCALTVLFFPCQRIIADEFLNKFQQFDDAINEEISPIIGKMERYDPAFILHLSIHSLSMGYLEPLEFASLGLLAVAFASLSSADHGMRKLGYEALWMFLGALKTCRRNKHVNQLRVLLGYMQNRIEEPWQRIPTVYAVFAAEASLILLDPSHEHYGALSKLLRLPTELKRIPLFHKFFWSSAVNFRSQRLWELRLLYVGLNSDDDSRVYIRNSILPTMMSFYSSPVADNETKGLILQIVRKSVKLHKMARYLAENCGLLSWLSSIIAMFTAKLIREEETRLAVVLEVVTDVLKSRKVVECLQGYALEELMEITSHLYRLLCGGLVSIEENAVLVNSILQIVSSTLRISQKRKMYQPHFTLSLEGIFQLYEAVTCCDAPPATACAETALNAILMTTPPVDIICMDSEILTSFLLWGTSTALKCDLKSGYKPNESRRDAKTLMKESEQETLVSKFLRWLSASVILGKLYSKVDNSDPKLSRKTSSETLWSLLECIEKKYEESSGPSNMEKIVGAVIFYLQLLLSTNHRAHPSVVCAISFLLLPNGSRNSGSEFNGDDREFVRSLCSRISSPPEANPSWRWSYHQPWRDLSSEPATDLQKMNELHSCQQLLLILSEMLEEKPADSKMQSHKHLEISSVLEWERSLMETE